MRDAIEQRIRDDAADDASFRDALLADAGSAVRERYGIDVPQGVTLRVIEESSDEVVLVLPQSGAIHLSEADLESVAGGTIYTGDGCGR